MRYLLLAILSLLLCSSCIQIGSDPQQMYYYLLDSNPKMSTILSSKTLNINIELTDFPEYLDRLQIVTRNNNNGINISDSGRWAEPLQDNLLRIIRESLALMLPNSSITVSPWENSNDEAIKVKLMINKFLGKLDEKTQIDIRWIIDNGRDQIIQEHFIDQQAIGNSYQDLVVGLNSGINIFSQGLAKKLADQ